MNKEPQEIQDLGVLLQRHACRVGVDELRTSLSSGYGSYRRQRRVDRLRYAAAICFATIVLPLGILATWTWNDASATEINAFANNLMLA